MRILRLLSTRPLPCGCFVGMYETYAGPVLPVIERRGADCTCREHRPGAPLDEGRAGESWRMAAEIPVRRAVR